MSNNDNSQTMEFCFKDRCDHGVDSWSEAGYEQQSKSQGLLMRPKCGYSLRGETEQTLTKQLSWECSPNVTSDFNILQKSCNKEILIVK